MTTGAGRQLAAQHSHSFEGWYAHIPGIKVASSPFVLGGLACYAVSVVVWIMALSRVPVSVAYPMLSIGYIVNAFAAWALFGESVTAQKLAGIGFIVIAMGVFGYGEIISNLARGGHPAACPITPELQDLAGRAAEAVGAVYCGVDLLETAAGLSVIEVNGTPSAKGIFQAMGLDATAAIAEHVYQNCYLRGRHAH